MKSFCQNDRIKTVNITRRQNHPKAKYTIFLKLNFGLKNILIYCFKHLEQYLLDLEPQITISQSKLGNGVASQNLKELAMSAIGVK